MGTRWLVCLLLALVLQTQFSFAGIPLSLGIVVVYAFGLRCFFSRQYLSLPDCPEILAALFGASVGLVEDIIEGHLVGPGFLSKGVIGYLFAILCSDLLFRWTPLLGGITLCMFTLMDGLITLGLRILFSEFTFSSTGVLQTIAVQAAVNSLFGFAIKPPDEAVHG